MSTSLWWQTSKCNQEICTRRQSAILRYALKYDITHTTTCTVMHTHIQRDKMSDVISQYLLMINIQSHKVVCNQCTTPQPNQLHSIFRIKDTSMRKAWLFFIILSLKKQAEIGTKGLNFHRTSVFLQCKNLSGVSFGPLRPVEGHYLWALDAGKSFKKQEDNSGRQPRSESRGKSMDTSTAAPSSLLHLRVLFSLSWRWASHRY